MPSYVNSRLLGTKVIRQSETGDEKNKIEYIFIAQRRS